MSRTGKITEIGNNISVNNISVNNISGKGGRRPTNRGVRGAEPPAREVIYPYNSYKFPINFPPYGVNGVGVWGGVSWLNPEQE